MTPEEIVERAAEVLAAAGAETTRGYGQPVDEDMAQALADAGLLPTEVSWGVLLDDIGSTDLYDTEAEARDAASRIGGTVVRTMGTPWTEVTP